MMGETLGKRWVKIGLLAIVGLLLVGGLVWAGVLIGRQQAIRDTQYVIRISPIPSPLISFSPTLLPTFSPETTSSPDETAGWKTFLSPRCNFSIKVPLEWSVEDIELVPGTDNPNYQYGCVFVSAPDYKIVGETQEGLGLFISRTIPGAKFKSVVINSIDDYIRAIENILEPAGQAKNVRPKAIGNISGKYFEFGAAENASSFVFMKNNFIYEISWLQGYTGVYKDKIDQILSTFRFLD